MHLTWGAESGRGAGGGGKSFFQDAENIPKKFPLDCFLIIYYTWYCPPHYCHALLHSVPLKSLIDFLIRWASMLKLLCVLLQRCIADSRAPVVNSIDKFL